MSQSSEIKGTARYVTPAIMQEMLDTQASKLTEHFDQKLETLLQPIKSELLTLKDQIAVKDTEIELLKNELDDALEVIGKQGETLDLLEERLGVVEAYQVDSKESFKMLEERVEERTNRQLRQTVVEQNIKEKKDES